MRAQKETYNSLTERIGAYFPDLDDAPFLTGAQQMKSWGRFIDLVISLSYASIEDEPGENLNRVASFMNDRETKELYAPADAEAFDGREEMEDVFYTLLVKGYDEDGTPLFPLSELLSGLSAYEKWLVILGYIGNQSARYGRLFGSLQEKLRQAPEPTLGLAWDLARFFLIAPDEIYDENGGHPYPEESVFTQYMLLPFDEDEDYAYSLSRRLILEPTVNAFIAGRRGNFTGKTSGASDAVTELLPLAEEEPYIAFEECYRKLRSTLLGSSDSTEDFVIELTGEKGSGKRFLLRQAAAAAGVRVLSVDIGALLLLNEEHRSAVCRDIVLKCALYGWIAYIDHVPKELGEYSNEFYELLSRLQEGQQVICIGTEKGLPLSMVQLLRGHHRKILLPEASQTVQLALWRIFARERELSFPEDYDLNELISKYNMNPGRISEALFAAKLLLGGSSVLDIGVLEEQIRLLSAVEFEDNATKLSSPFTWDDLVVGDTSRHLLELACDRVRYSLTVNASFGFGRKLPYGRGVAIVLYGPPGTGKTMAAQVIAKELNLDIYRVDLSQVSSKYIGETEKNLGAIFDAAKNSNAILFFDEADALFSKRTEVSSSNDKYANAETSYLLQKIEEYAGVSVLATNNMQNFDAAFKRRMTFLIPLEAPDVKTRQLLWGKAYPPEAPLSPLVDPVVLAEALELTGAQIKNIATESAYIAAAKGGMIDYEAIIEAADMECAKTGSLNVGQSLRSAILTASI